MDEKHPNRKKDKHNPSYHNARHRAVIRTEFCLYASDLKYFLVFGCYIGRMLLPKSKWEVKHYG